MNKLFFYFPVGKTLTGQEFATRLILKTVSDLFDCKVNYLPVYDRSKKSFFYKIQYSFMILISWVKIFRLFFSGSPKVYLNLGQTKFSIFRDGWPFLVLKKIKPSLSIVISLHGHVFTTWSGQEKVCRSFLSVLKCAKVVTVLGEVQKSKLLSLGLSDEQVSIVNNTCEIESSSKNVDISNVRLLYLSNLMEEKGYKEYLSVLKILSEKKLECKISAVLCGKVFGDNSEKQDINSLINKINANESVNVQWVEGAYGKAKEDLFKACDIFVFPSKYKVEAQPIVLIEAMASSCAIITTKVGEIPSTVSQGCASLLDNADANKIASEVLRLIQCPSDLKLMQFESSKRFNEFFSEEIYKANWLEIFNGLDK